MRIIAIIACAVISLSCIQPGPQKPSPVVKADKNALNLIYFVPKDLDTLPGFETRLSKLMLWAQDWFKDQMTMNGYPGKTFHLTKGGEPGKVKIVVVRGSEPKSAYPYEGGYAKVFGEIETFRQSNPDEFGSEFALIIIPRYTFKEDGTPHGGPFYGMSPNCFALDYEGLDIKHMGSKNSRPGYLFSVWFGGMLHELGHGLRLPHNAQKVSEYTDPKKGMALMCAGNGTLGISPTFLTAADCAILNVNPVFNTAGPRPDAAGNNNIRLESFTLDYDNNKKTLIAKGKVSAATRTNSVVFFNDPDVNNEGSGVAQDYNAVSWEVKPQANGTFYIEMPINELRYKDSTAYELRILAIQANGNMKYFHHSYAFKDNIPLIEQPPAENIHAVTFKILEFSSQERYAEDGKIENLTDKDITTYWHSNWSGFGAGLPHFFTIEFPGKNQLLKGILVGQRQGLGRAIKEFELYTGPDKNNLQLVGRFTASKKNGSQYITLPKPVTARFAKFVITTTWDGQKFASLAELGFY